MMEILRFEQGTEEWHRARAGIPTASRFGDILAKGEGKTRAKYMRVLAGEIVSGQVAESFSNAHMERGKIMEADVRNVYAFLTDEDVEQIGFIRNGAKGCSPDALVGANGMLEIKTKLPDLMIECYERERLKPDDCFPPEHKAQCQGNLWIGEREWIDLVCFWPNMPPFRKRAYRQEAYIRDLEAAVAIFNEELAAMAERARQYRTSI